MVDVGTTGLSFEELGIAKALHQKSLTVPLNQRSYAWSDQIETLLSDLYKAFDEGDQIYFLGTLVLTRGASLWQVADGQQRLATISIVIAAARDYLLELNDSQTSSAYESRYLLEYEPRKKDYVPKLQMNYEDHEFFVETILKPPSQRTPYTGRHFFSHDLLTKASAEAAQQIRNITAAYTDRDAKAARIYDWIDFLHENAKVIVITVPGQVGNAYKMFETLNARGMPASQVDILKNYLFDRAKDKIGIVHPRWISMKSTIEDLGEDELQLEYLRHFWISQNGPTTVDELGNKVEAAIKGERQAVDLITNLDSFAVDYVALLSPLEHVRWKSFTHQTRRCIYNITRVLGIKQIRPLMVAVARNFEQKEIETSFSLMLSWSVRFLIAGGGGGGVLDRHYGLSAMEISKKKITTAKDLSRRMGEFVPNDEVFRKAFAIASVRRSQLARYYLRALELYVKEEPRPQFVPNEDVQAVNLEHILPVTPSDEWKIEDDVAQAYYRRIGNMVLLNTTDNVEIGNKNFAEKKQMFKGHPYILTKEVAAYRKWGPEEIEKRQAKLAELAPFVWPY